VRAASPNGARYGQAVAADDRTGTGTGAAFYAVADSNAFLGVVGLINSLRLLGHDEPFLLLDCGLTLDQRLLLEPHIDVHQAPGDGHPTLLKSFLPLARPAQVMVLLDADVIVVRHLGTLVEAAAGGCVVAFENDRDRYRPEWGALLGLGTLPRRPYVNAGHLLFPQNPGIEVLIALEQALERVDLKRAIGDGRAPRTRSRDDPFFYTDQDVLNALLAASLPPERILVLDSRLAPFPPFTGVVADAKTLRCALPDGAQPYLLHHVLRKPWLTAMPDSVYSLLLRRLLTHADVPLRIPGRLVPLRFRSGRLASADRERAHIQALLRGYTRGRLGVRPRLQALISRFYGSS
jgi:hypothetical protein